jgi:peptidyl-prolyl cis-trans isomerase B (cyclophilin B)
MPTRLLSAIFAILTFAALSSAAAAANLLATITTNKGPIVVQLYPKRAPVTVQNFIRYVQAGHYDGTIFHRVIKGFMIQGGGFTADGFREKRTGRGIRNEATNGLKNVAGTIAMARTPDPHSATSQFFINTADNHGLNHQNKSARGWGYAVFGKVVEGMKVVVEIEDVKTGSRGDHEDVPQEPIVITSISLSDG